MNDGTPRPRDAHLIGTTALRKRAGKHEAIKTLYRALVLAAAAFVGLGTSPTQPSRVHRLTIVIQAGAARILPQVNGLRDGLEELKYVEGQNLLVNLLHEEKRESLLSRLRADIERGAVDVIVALGTAETAAAREVTTKIPIIFMPATDPVQSGFVRSLATPQTNLTGLTFFTDSESVGKQLETFKQVVPALRQVVAVVDGRQDSGMNSQLRQRLTTIAAGLGIELAEQSVTSAAEASQAIARAKHGKNAGIFIVCSSLFRDIEGLASVATKRRLALFGCSAAQVAEQKVLMTYAPDLYAIGYRGAWFVDRILKGAKPQTLAVETPRKFELVINRKAAQEIGLTIPPEMLRLSDRVFD